VKRKVKLHIDGIAGYSRCSHGYVWPVFIWSISQSQTHEWLGKIKSHMQPFTTAAKTVAKENKRRIFYSAMLTAVIVFCTALVTAISADPARIGLFTFVSASLSALVAFCQAVLEFWRRRNE